MKKLNELINRIDTPVWLEVLFIVVFAIRIPTFFEPYWSSLDLQVLDLGIGMRPFWIKALLTVWNMVILYFFWKLVVILFPNQKTVQKSATYTFAILSALTIFQTNVYSLQFLLTGVAIVVLYFLFSKTTLFNGLKTKSFIVVSILLALSLVLAILLKDTSAVSVIPMLPWVSIFVGLLISSKKLEQLLSILPLTLVLIAFVYFKYDFISPKDYYLNVGKLVTNGQNKETYFSYFGSSVNRNYQIADFLNTSFSKNDSIYIYGKENRHIYAIAQRSMPNINILPTPPTLIVVLPDYRQPAELLSLITRQYMLISQIQGAQIWHIIRSK